MGKHKVSGRINPAGLVRGAPDAYPGIPIYIA